ncbi:protein-tyrosine phosphatase-like protein [Mycena amicta]|nr:protein-tyrosine phosphatase-like protein [Mycena amicta]
MCAGSWSAPPKLTSSISTASLENYPLRPSVSCPSASTSYSSSTSSWPSSSTSFSSASSAPSSFSNCEQYPSSPSGSRDHDPPPPSGAPIWAGDPALAPYLSSQPSFSSLTSNIAIGDLAFAEDAAGLVREGITHVVSVVGERGVFLHVPDFIPPSNRLHIPLPDAPFAELVGELEPVVEWVKAALVEGGVVLSQESAQQQVTPQTVHILIHCAHGISRSPAIGAALLVALPLVSDDNNVPSTLSAAAALEYVRARRPAADVNWGFRAQLVEWEGMCRDRGV